jgi:hypothetical protein
VCSHIRMNLAENSDQTGLHPFGGCNRLLEQYRTVGRALLGYERLFGGALIPSGRSAREFSTNVSFVPVEVLETYRDDLLDLGVGDEGLFIRKNNHNRGGVTLLAFLLVGMSGALFALHGDLTAALLPALLFVTFLSGIASTLYFLPRAKVIRRFSFATVVAQEVAQRRGHDKTHVGNFATRLLMGEMWKLNDYSSPKAFPPHPARVGVRYFH